MSEGIKKHLKELLNNGKDWEKCQTDNENYFIVKAPAPKNKKDGTPRLFLVIHPFIAEGKRQKRGLYISGKKVRDIYLEHFKSDDVDNILTILDDINPKEKKEKKIIFKVDKK